MKTVMILVDQFYLHGGIEKLVSIKANYWAEKFGYKVIIVSTEQNNNEKIYHLSDEVEFVDLNINYHRGISFFHPKNLSKLINNFKKIKHAVAVYSPDFILVASHIPMTYLLPFVKTKAKTIKEFHFSKYSHPKNVMASFFQKIEERYNYLVVLSLEERSFYPSNNVKVIPNPVEITPSIQTDIIKLKPNVAAAVLRFAPVKQIDKMVEVWDLFYKNNLDWKLYIYGDISNDYFVKIQQLVKDMKLQETIIFKGKTDNVYQALENVRLLLMTSSNECFPMVILEANACGVPVVSFDSPTGPRNIINDNVDGIVVPLDDISTFATQLDKIANDEYIYNQMALKSIVNSENYQLEKVMNIWKKEIFESND